MKVTNWRRKLAASLVAGGLLAPSIVGAANLDTNLVVNPGFEDVNPAITCCYNNSATQFNSWSDGSIRGFAYNYGQGYDEGGPLAGGGTYYFVPGADATSEDTIATPGKVSQNIGVSTGASGTQIASGEAAVVLSAFFTSYHGQNNHGSLHIDFLNAGGTSLGSTVLTAKTPRPWHQERLAGLVPVGTATLRASLYGDADNAYIDNVDVQVTNAANELLFLEVNTTTGQAAIKNQSGEAVHIDYYKITSAAGALNSTAWSSFQEQNLAGFPAGNGSGNGWEQFGGSSSNVIGESYLTGNSQVSNNATIGLGNAFNVAGAHDLVFLYGAVVGSGSAPEGDYNENGVVDAADYTVWRDTLGSTVTAFSGADGDGDGNVDQEDYDVWKADFGAGGGLSGTSNLVRGFVRYVPSGTGTAIPEPSSVFLVGAGLALMAVGGRWKTSPGE